MTITCDTELSELINSTEVSEQIDSFQKSLSGKISDRISALDVAMGSGFSDSVLIEDVPVFYNAATTVKGNLGTLSTNVDHTCGNAITNAVDKEKDELSRLKLAVIKKIEEIDDAIRVNNTAEENALSETPDPEKAQSIIDTYHGDQGSTTILLNSRTTYEHKLDDIKTREIALGVEGVKGSEAVGPAPTGGVDKNEGAYSVKTDGTADEMYDDACDLRDELGTELGYLGEYKTSTQVALDVLESNYKNGLISEEDYERLHQEYTDRMASIDNAIAERQPVYDKLDEITRNNIGTDDGALKDARDWGSNDVVAAKESLADVNKGAANITPLGQVISETQPDGSTRTPFAVDGVFAVPGAFGNYSDNIVNYGISNGDTHVSNTTMEAAYLAAKSQGTATELSADPGVYVYSTKDYFDSAIQDSESAIYLNTYGISEYDSIDYPGMSTDNSMGDTVYDSNTGMYYSYYEYLKLKGGS